MRIVKLLLFLLISANLAAQCSVNNYFSYSGKVCGNPLFVNLEFTPITGNIFGNYYYLGSPQKNHFVVGSLHDSIFRLEDTIGSGTVPPTNDHFYGAIKGDSILGEWTEGGKGKVCSFGFRCEAKNHDNLEFQVLLKPSDTRGYKLIKSFTVINRKTKEILMSANDLNCYVGSTCQVVLRDMNFDSIADFSVVEYFPRSPYNDYRYRNFIFDSSTGRFIPGTWLDGFGVLNYLGDKKLVLSQSVDAQRNVTDEYYRYTGDGRQIILYLKKERKENDSHTYVTEYENQNGKPVAVKTYTED